MKSLKKSLFALLIAGLLIGAFAGAAYAEEGDPETPEPKNGWSEDGTQYFKNDEAVTGRVTIDGEKYSFTKNGVLQTGLVTFKEDGEKHTRYYTEKGEEKGQMVTGWKTISRKKYYFDTKTGDMKKGLRKVEGSWYNFNYKTGELLKGLNKTKKDGRIYYVYTSKKNATLQRGTIKVNDKTRYYTKASGEVEYKMVRKGKYWLVYKPNGKQVKNLLGTKFDSKKYWIRINKSTNVTTILTLFEGEYSLPVKVNLCSTGKSMATPSPTGTFTIHSKWRWMFMIGDVYCQWLTYISNNCLIHSEIYVRPNNKTLKTSCYNKLGHAASHGCVRMAAADAKWIYDNCPGGTKMTLFYGSGKDDPLGKPKLKKLPSWHNWDPTDPTAQKYCKQKGCHQN